MDQDPTEDEDDELSSFPPFRRTKQIIKILEPAFKEKILVWNGHFKDGEYFYSEDWWSPPETRLRQSFEDRFTILMSNEDFQRLEEAAKTGALLDPPVVFEGRMRDLSCPYCDQRLILGYDGQRLLVVGDDPCPHPGGLQTEWELNVPSGKLVVANDLRTWFPTPEDYSVNALIGQHLTTLAYAKVGMSHGFVSNTSPHVFQTGDKFIIGSYSEERFNEETEEYEENPDPCPWGEEVASVCTDLWWYSIVDADEFKRRIAHYTPDQEFIWEDEQVCTQGRDGKPWHYADVVDVKPGVYLFRHPCGTNHNASNVEFASFEWVREPDPLVDYVGREKALNLNALEVLIESCLSWPTLYMGLGYSAEDEKQAKNRPAMVKRWEELSRERKIDYLARAADHFMCVLGGGVEWHEKGFPRSPVSEEAKRLAKAMDTSRGGSWRGWHDTLTIDGVAPPFQEDYDTYVGKWKTHHQSRDSAPPKSFKRSWYPISEGYGGLCQGAGISNSYTSREVITLAPSFVLLGLNICQNAILYGEEPRLNTDVWPPAYEIPWCRERMKLFGRCYRGLREKHPDLVFDTSFDRWMKGVDFDQYVANFDFGPEHPPEEKWGPRPKTIKEGDYFEFDARKLGEGASFCWHPRIMGGANAHKKDAHRYSINIVGETMSPLGHIHHDYKPGRSNIPLWVVGRVVRGTGDGYLSKELEVAFDYGTDDMTSLRWSIRESDMKALRQFNDKAEYEELLGKCKTFYLEVEAEIDAKLAKDKATVTKLAKAKKSSAKKATRKKAKTKAKKVQKVVKAKVRAKAKRAAKAKKSS